MTPVKVQQFKWNNLPLICRKAIPLATDCISMEDWKRHNYRIETYNTSDVVAMVRDIWGWNVTSADCTHTNDRERISKIKRLIPVEGQWPYISYWARDIEELLEVDSETDGTKSFNNHGDGWHRVIAANELNLPTIDIVFVEM